MKNINNIIEKLEKEYEGMGCALNFTSPFELLIATMLSAQTTDVNVNKATAVLYSHYNTPEKIAAMDTGLLEEYIHICGFYKTKARHVKETSTIICEKYNGEVPDTMEELVKLPGVGRKTANVVLSNAFGKPAMAVDTHVFRVSNRIGLAHAKNVEETEKQLMENIPRDKWSEVHHYLIWHGRKVCTARNPKCDNCILRFNCEMFSRVNDDH